MILTLFRKAVFAGKITIMRNVQAKCLNNCLSFFYFSDIALINILCKQLTCRCQLCHCLQKISQIFFCINIPKLFKQIFCRLLFF